MGLLSDNPAIKKYLESGNIEDLRGLDYSAEDGPMARILAGPGNLQDNIGTLYKGFADGEIQLSKDQLDRLLIPGSSDYKGITPESFRELSPEVQQWAYANPQAFMQDALAMRNSANQSLLSVGAEGGARSMSDYGVSDGRLTMAPGSYMQVNDDDGFGALSPFKIDPGLQSLQGTNKAISSIASGGSIRDSARTARNDYQGNMANAIREYNNTALKAVQPAIDANEKPAHWVAKGLGVDKSMSKYIDQPGKDTRGIMNLSAADAQLINRTKNTNSGVFSRADRVSTTRENADAVNTIRTAGAMAAATNIPIVSWIGLAANGVANARLKEADLQTGRQAVSNFGGAALGAYGGNLGTAGNVARGAASGAVGAYGSGQDVGKGALIGAAGGAMGALGGAMNSEGVNPLLTKATTGAIMGGLRGGEEGALKGAATGAVGYGTSLLGQEIGGKEYGGVATGLLNRVTTPLISQQFDSNSNPTQSNKPYNKPTLAQLYSQYKSQRGG